MNEKCDFPKELSAINEFCNSVKKLENLGIFRSKKWEADYGEWLVKHLYNAEIAESKTQEGWDIKINEIRVQVKTHFIPEKGPKYTSFSIKHKFDELIIIGLLSDLKVGEMYRINHDQLISLSKKENDNDKYRIYWSDLKSYAVNRSNIPNVEKMMDFFAQ